VVDLVIYAIPAFVLLLVVELFSFRYARDEDLVGYEARDTRTSLSMGGGNVVINAVWKLAVVFVYAALYELTPLRMPADEWWTYVLLFLADDLAYYWFHRIHHEVRVFWASHVVHHSSQHYNLSTALRQTWTPMTALPFWAPLALLGFAPWMILTQQAISLDRNYGGILIVWDRIFGTFQGETERPRYGLTKNIRSFRPTRVAFHEFVEMARDVRGADSWRDRLGYVFRGPGWSPDGSGGGTRG
jgi:sterol desaturase/sphingolipid hydroxylase (fatty acid hydroxylase superfamily)